LPEELAQLAGDGRPSEGAPKEEREYRIDGAVGRKRAAAGRSAGKGAGIPLGAPTTRRSPVRAPKNVIDVYWRPQESGSDTMLNILYIERKNKRERKSGSVNTQWTTLYCVVID
jgi:hypothetical protein